MRTDVLQHPRVQEWRRKHPQEWWAFNQLRPNDAVRERVIAAVLAGREDDEAVDELVRLGEAMEGNKRAARAGALTAPPPVGERRPLEVTIKRMTKMLSPDRGLFFRVDFATPHGWSGYFDTTAPDVVERISRHRQRSRPLTVVGEITAHPYDFLVVLGGHVRIV